MTSPYEFTYRRSFDFSLSREAIWARLADRDRYESWWPWMRDLQGTGESLEPGAVLAFRVVSPLPYRMTLRVTVEDSKEPEFVAVSVDGHLRGTGRIDLGERPDSAKVTISWDVEVADRAMRIGARLARPAIKWGQDWAVRRALVSFSDHVLSNGSRPRDVTNEHPSREAP